MVVKKLGFWRKKYFGTRTSLILTSVVIGLLTAICAVILKNAVSFIQESVHQISISEVMTIALLLIH